MFKPMSPAYIALIFGRKYTCAILQALKTRVHCFNDVRRAVPTASPCTVSANLKKMIKLGWVKCEKSQTGLQRSSYSLTKAGMIAANAGKRPNWWKLAKALEFNKFEIKEPVHCTSCVYKGIAFLHINKNGMIPEMKKLVKARLTNDT